MENLEEHAAEYYRKTREEEQGAYIKNIDTQRLDLHQRIRSAEPALRHLAKELEEPFREGRYAAILGDDRSGRLPALFLGRIASRIAEQSGGPPPEKLFYAGGKRVLHDAAALEAFDAYAAELKQKLQGRVLLVTEYMSSGVGIGVMGQILKRHDIPFDVASVSLSVKPEHFYDGSAQQEQLTAKRMLGDAPEEILDTIQAELPQDAKLIFGEAEGAAGLSFYHPKEASGVEELQGSAIVERDSKARRELVVKARSMIYEAADRIYSQISQENGK